MNLHEEEAMKIQPQQFTGKFEALDQCGSTRSSRVLGWSIMPRT